ncbi:gamma-glutamyltransferase family protein [Parvularcula sp. ZS-1/3]|uniref:Gamma-glutamyltransferase family protein n=1 Tax=Parvularcula mediterranea TaxID=2732508 RepID=A0A7Y3RJV2_9PROT|nr:gamma-glutamyltransferase family protein [Parvularcula mediterranea]NNU15422.1 gamma-glutamyltransferase family protein [Parvularcula mediterranea]
MDCRALILTVLAIAACGKVDEAPEGNPSPPPAEKAPWIVAAAHPLAVDAGAAVLAEGGSAVDAAVAIQAVLGLVEPQSSGLGGGAFMLHYDASSGDVTAYDGREMAPASVVPEVFYTDEGEPMSFFEAVTSGRAVGVPGTVAVLDLAHREHGALPWQRLFEPAEGFARDGFAMPQRLRDSLDRFASFRKDPQAAIYLTEEGAVKAYGETVQNLPYAKSVQEIAAGGAAAFYSGEIAQAIIDRVNGVTGLETLTLEDFANYRPEKREAVCTVTFDRRVCSMPPPSSGGVTLLQILKLYELTAGDAPLDEGLLAYIEASRLAYADRNRFLGDPTAMGTDGLSAGDLTARLVSDAYLRNRAQLIGDVPAETVEPGDPDGLLLKEGRIDDWSYEVPATSHFSVRDGEGNIVSMTTTVEIAFGSQIMAAGMVLNNQLTDFSRVPYDDEGRLAVNAPGAGKRPMSSMTPSLVFDRDGTPLIAIGSPGGPAIIGYVARPLIQHLGTGIPLSEAAVAPHVVVPRGTVTVEEGATELAAQAEALGYEVRQRSLASGLYGFALGADGSVDLVSDPRREGTARMED